MVILTHDESNTHVKLCHLKSQSGKVSWENEMYSSLLSMEKSRNRQLESLKLVKEVTALKKEREREKTKETYKTKVSWNLNYLVTYKIRVIDSQSF